MIDEGLKALASRGAAELSLRHLAREVGVTPPAAYRHFRSKDALLAAISEEGFARLNTAFADARIADSPQERLIETGIAYVRFAKEQPALFRLMFGAEEQEEAGPEAEAAFATLKDLSAAVSDLGTDNDEALRVETVRRWSVVHGFAMLLIDGRLDRPDAYEDLLREVLAPLT